MKEVKHTPENSLKGCIQMLNNMFQWARVKDGRATFTTSEETWNVYKKFVSDCSIIDDSETAAERDSLKQWKESAMQVLATWDKVCDSIQNRNDIKVGESISLKAVELIQERDRLKEEVEHLNQVITRKDMQSITKIDSFKEENERLKKDLSDCQDYTPSFLSSFNEKMSKLRSINRELCTSALEAIKWAKTNMTVKDGLGLRNQPYAYQYAFLNEIEEKINQALKNSTL